MMTTLCTFNMENSNELVNVDMAAGIPQTRCWKKKSTATSTVPLFSAPDYQSNVTNQIGLICVALTFRARLTSSSGHHTIFSWSVLIRQIFITRPVAYILFTIVIYILFI